MMDLQKKRCLLTSKLHRPTISQQAYLYLFKKDFLQNVEFVPTHNLKCGINTTYKRLTAGIQLTYLSDQYSDASNALKDNVSGTLGLIPAYNILDFSSSLNLKKSKLFFGINNVLNNYYFTRRANGYPGPGIIPAQTRNYYITLELSYQ